MAQILKAPSHTAERYNEDISSDRHANSICAKTGQEHTDKNKGSQQIGRRPKGLHRLNGDMKPTHRTERYEGGEPSTNDYDQQTQVFDFKFRCNKPHNPTAAIPTWAVPQGESGHLLKNRLSSQTGGSKLHNLMT